MEEALEEAKRFEKERERGERGEREKEEREREREREGEGNTRKHRVRFSRKTRRHVFVKGSSLSSSAPKSRRTASRRRD